MQGLHVKLTDIFFQHAPRTELRRDALNSRFHNANEFVRNFIVGTPVIERNYFFFEQAIERFGICIGAVPFDFSLPKAQPFAPL